MKPTPKPSTAPTPGEAKPEAPAKPVYRNEGKPILLPFTCGEEDIQAFGLTCTSDEPVRHVMAKMTRHRVRHVPVVDGGVIAGIVSIGDVVKSRLEELELEKDVMRDAYIART